MKRIIDRTITRTIRTTKNHCTLVTLAATLMLSAGSANAFTLDLNFADVAKSVAAVARASASGRSSGSAAGVGLPDVQHGLTLWSNFPRRGPARRHSPSTNAAVTLAIAADSAPGAGRWLRHRARQAAGSALNTPMQGDIEVAFLGIDGLANLHLLKERFLRSFVFGWRFQRWFAQHEAVPEPELPSTIPLPAALLLLGSALFSLVSFGRRLPSRSPAR